jgi:hypothetical protein
MSNPRQAIFLEARTVGCDAPILAEPNLYEASSDILLVSLGVGPLAQASRETCREAPSVQIASRGRRDSVQLEQAEAANLFPDGPRLYRVNKFGRDSLRIT